MTSSSGKFLLTAITNVCNEGSHVESVSSAGKAGEKIINVLLRFFIQVDNIITKTKAVCVVRY